MGKGTHHVHHEEIFTERKFSTLFYGKWCYYLLSLFSIGHGDKVTVDYGKSEGSYQTRRCDKDMSRTGVRLELPHVVKFQTDSCLQGGSMIICYEIIEHGQLSNRAEL